MAKDDIPTLHKWEAKRAGGRITIHHSAGKVTGIEAIEPLDGEVIATRKCGATFRLAVRSE